MRHASEHPHPPLDEPPRKHPRTCASIPLASASSLPESRSTPTQQIHPALRTQQTRKAVTLHALASSTPIPLTAHCSPLSTLNRPSPRLLRLNQEPRTLSQPSTLN